MTLEEIKEGWKEDWPYQAPVYINWLIQRVEELEEGIRNLKAERNPEGIAMEELYKLLEE